MDVKAKCNCTLCNGTGYSIGEWGQKTVCKCIIEQLNDIDENNQPASNNTNDQPIILFNNSDTKNNIIQKMISSGIVGEGTSEVTFDVNKLIASIPKTDATIDADKVKVEFTAMNNVYTLLRLGKLPTKSYAFGLDRWCGRSEFVTAALVTASLMKKSIAPYVDLTALYEKYANYVKELRFNKKSGNTVESKDKYSWKDYTEADFIILATSESSLSPFEIETEILLTLLAKRSMNYKPTILLYTDAYQKYINTRLKSKNLFLPTTKDYTFDTFENYSIFSQ